MTVSVLGSSTKLVYKTGRDCITAYPTGPLAYIYGYSMAKSPSSLAVIENHVAKLRSCSLCPSMVGPVVTGNPVCSPLMLVGQAPGAKEGVFGKPFAWTAGKTLFRWFSSLGITEEQFRTSVYMAAVCRCFPGKNPKGGDRVPDANEIQNCSQWLRREVELLKPSLIVPVGKLAITQFLGEQPLANTVGSIHRESWVGSDCDVIPLPHPSGASTWHRTEPGKTLLSKSLRLIKQHPAFKQIT